jgi:DNA-binding PadR family transcriptional regulator
MGFRSDVSALILGALQNGPQHGYSIVRRIRESGAATKLSEGQIYPYLHRLEREQHVTAEWRTDTGGAPRRVYQITESGLAELSRQRSAWQKFSSGVGVLLAASQADPEVNRA